MELRYFLITGSRVQCSGHRAYDWPRLYFALHGRGRTNYLDLWFFHMMPIEKKQRGLTIVQIMMILLVAGFAGAYLADALLDYRCASDPARKFCEDRRG